MRGSSVRAAAAGEAPRGPAHAVALVAAALLVACGSRPGAPPRPTSITPDRAGAALPVPVLIRGEGFGVEVRADFGGGGDDVVDARFQALLGATRLEDVALRQDGSLAATVPPGLPEGTHDLTVVAPSGRAGTLPQAYRVLAATSAAPVARFRVEPLEAQVAFAPFTVAVTALDAAGEVVDDFQGEVLLSDLSGAIVPPTIGLFAGGRWTGAVEVRAPHAADVLVVTDPGGAAGASAAFDVVPPPPAALRLDAAPPPAQAGACAGPVTVSLRDAFGFPTTASAPVALSLTATPSAGFTLHGDAGCATPGAPAVPAGEGAVSFWFVATAAGPLALAASAPSLAGDTRSATVVAGPPAALAFTTPPRTAAAGACSDVLTVEVRDAWGNLAPGGVAGIALAAAPPGGLSFFSDACGTPATALAIPPGATTAGLWFRGAAAGAVGIALTAPGLAGASQDALVVAADAVAIAFATPARAATAGACSAPVVVEARDAFGNPATAARAIRLTLSAAPGAGFALHADAACTTPASGAVIAAGATGVTLSYLGTVAGEVTVTASAPRLGVAAQQERVEPAAPAAIVFASAPQTVEVGACSGAVTLGLRDAFGNASPAPGGLAVALGGSPAGLTFHSDAACSVPITAASVPAGTGAGVFHVRAAATGAYVASAAAAGVASASQPVTVVPAAPSRLAFTTAAQRVTAGACSGAVTVEVRDAFDDPVPLSRAAATAIALASPGLTLHADAACAGGAVSSAALPAGASAASFWFRGTVAGAAQVTASAAGVAPASQAETIVPAAAAALVFTTAAQTVSAGSCSGIVTLETRDAYGNVAPVSPAAPTILSLAAPGLAVHADPACAAAPVSSVTLVAGATRASFWFRGTGAGPAVVTASAGGVAPARQTETLVPGAADRLAITTAAQVVAAGACSAAVTVESRDGHGNPSPLAAVATDVTLTATGLTFFADAACAGVAVASVAIPAAGTTARFYLRGAVAGPVTITAAAPRVAAASQTETIVPAPASRLAFATAAQVVTAGACSGVVTVEARDAFGNAAPPSGAVATAVTLAAAGLAFFPDAACAGAAVTSVSIPAAGTTASFHLRGTVAGTVGLTASAAGLSSTTRNATIVPGPADHLAWETVGSPQLEAVAFAVTISALDAHGNQAAWTGPATLSASPGAVACVAACTAGAVTAPFAGGRWAGTVLVPAAATGVTLTAAGAGATGTSNAFDVAGPASRSPPSARITASSQVIAPGDTVTFDASGSSDWQTPLASLEVSWHFEARDADGASAAAPAAAPWTAWSTTKSASHAFANDTGAPIVYRPRLAVRDTETGPGGPDLGYAAGVVVVLPRGGGPCVVDTDALVADNGGSTSCDVRGPDGRLSLAEALHAANASAAPLDVVFDGPRQIAGAVPTSLQISRPVRIVATPGAVVLDGVSLEIAADGVLVSGLELARLATPLTVLEDGDALLEDLHVHDGQGIEVRGRARLVRARMAACGGGACVRERGAGAYLAVFFSDLIGSGGDVGISLETCAGAGPTQGGSSPYLAFSNGWAETGAAFVGASVLTGFGTAVVMGPSASCGAPWITNVTFDGNGTGVRRVSGTGGFLHDSVFTRQGAYAVDPGVCAFTSNARNVSWGNAADGCIGAQLVTADPLYVYAATRDYRLQLASPARDQGNAANAVEVDDAGPGLFLGAAPDRGGRETY